MNQIEKRIAARDGNLKPGLYWVRKNEPDGTLETIAELRNAYPWEDDKRMSWAFPGDERRKFQTQNPEARNAYDIGDYLGPVKVNGREYK